MKTVEQLLNCNEPPWDIPVLPLKPLTRKQLFDQALLRAEKEGFILPISSGLLLAW